MLTKCIVIGRVFSLKTIQGGSLLLGKILRGASLLIRNALTPMVWFNRSRSRDRHTKRSHKNCVWSQVWSSNFTIAGPKQEMAPPYIPFVGVKATRLTRTTQAHHYEVLSELPYEYSYILVHSYPQKGTKVQPNAIQMFSLAFITPHSHHLT